ncbi:hypothetical protein [Nocardia sp. IFM 10818]
MIDDAESYEEREFREQAEARARLERALTHDSGAGPAGPGGGAHAADGSDSPRCRVGATRFGLRRMVLKRSVIHSKIVGVQQAIPSRVTVQFTATRSLRTPGENMIDRLNATRWMAAAALTGAALGLPATTATAAPPAPYDCVSFIYEPSRTAAEAHCSSGYGSVRIVAVCQRNDTPGTYNRYGTWVSPGAWSSTFCNEGDWIKNAWGEARDTDGNHTGTF